MSSLSVSFIKTNKKFKYNTKFCRRCYQLGWVLKTDFNNNSSNNPDKIETVDTTTHKDISRMVFAKKFKYDNMKDDWKENLVICKNSQLK